MINVVGHQQFYCGQIDAAKLLERGGGGLRIKAPSPSQIILTHMEYQVLYYVVVVDTHTN